MPRVSGASCRSPSPTYNPAIRAIPKRYKTSRPSRTVAESDSNRQHIKSWRIHCRNVCGGQNSQIAVCVHYLHNDVVRPVGVFGCVQKILESYVSVRYVGKESGKIRT